MSWWQAVLTVTIGNAIVLIPMLLNGYPGTKYGIPFPVLVRSSFGIRGAHIAALLRGLVACGWFGIQTWIGADAISQLFIKIAPALGELSPLPVLDITSLQFSCYIFFWLAQVRPSINWGEMDAWDANNLAHFAAVNCLFALAQVLPQVFLISQTLQVCYSMLAGFDFIERHGINPICGETGSACTSLDECSTRNMGDQGCRRFISTVVKALPVWSRNATSWPILGEILAILDG